MNTYSSEVSIPGLSEVPGGGSESSDTFAPIGRRDMLVVGAIMALWGVSAIVIDPVGDFPLNDDWAYGLPVKWLVETGRLRFTDWQMSTLFTHVIWGALFASVAGFSFTVLRISTLVIAIIGLAATYLTGRVIGLPRWLAAAVAGLLIVNPIFISLSNSFMMDSPFLSLAMLALFLLLRGLRRGHAPSYWAGWIVVLAATLQRQFALAIPLGLVVAVAVRDGLGRAWLVRAVLPTLTIIAVVMAYTKIVQATIGLPASYLEAQYRLVQVFKDLMHLRLGALKPLMYAVACGLMHLGWWMLPLLVMLPPSRDEGGRIDRSARIVGIVAAVSALAITAVLWATGRLMPVGSGGCILIDLGTGPRTLPGPGPRAPTLFWVAFTAASAFGASRLILALVLITRRNFTQFLETRDLRPAWLSIFFITTGAVYYVPCMYYGPWFDRYALPEMALLGLLIASEATRSAGTRWRHSPPRLAAAATLALVYLVFGVVSAHDYLAWNRSRWEGGRSLMADRSIMPGDIDGGFEFNEYFSWRDRPGGTYRSGAGVPQAQSPVKGSLVWDRSRFILSFSERTGFTRVHSLPVNRWFPLTPDQVLVLERSAESPSPAAAVPR